MNLKSFIGDKVGLLDHFIELTLLKDKPDIVILNIGSNEIVRFLIRLEALAKNMRCLVLNT